MSMELDRREAIKALGVGAVAAALPFTVSPSPAMAADDEYSHRRKKKKSQCEDESENDSTESDNSSTVAPSGYGDWATEGTEPNKNMKLIFKTMTENYGMSGAASVAIIANSIREVGGTFDPRSGENGARFDDVNNPYPSSGASSINGIYNGMNGGGGLWQFTPYEKFSLSEWFTGSKAVNKSAGWSVENEAAFLVERELNNPGEYELYLDFRYHMYKGDEPRGYRTSSYPGGTVNGVSNCDEGRVETTPVKPPTYLTLKDFCMATDPVAAATDFYYANEGGWRYDAAVPGTTLHFAGMPVKYPGIECYIPILTKILNTPAVPGNLTKISSWISGGGGGAAIINTASSSSDDDEECPNEDCENIKHLEAGDRLVETAMTQIGVPYLLGGNEWNKLLDCSGLVYHSMDKLGVCPRAYRTANDLRNFCIEHGVMKPMSERIPGDLFFIFNSGNSHTTAEIEHVGIYTGTNESGQDMILEETHWECIHVPIDVNSRTRLVPEVGRIMAAQPVASELGTKTSKECNVELDYLSDGPITQRQKEVIEAAKAAYLRWNGYSGGCVMMVHNCMQAGGLPYSWFGNGNGILCNHLYESWHVSSNKGDLKPGMIVSYGRAGAGFDQYGHVGIYVGNGKVICNINANIFGHQEMDLDQWLAMNGSCYVGWGAAEGPLKATYGWCWYGGIDLSASA